MDDNSRIVKNIKRQSIFLLIIGFLVIGVFVSYASVFYSADFLGDNENGISTCSLNMNFKDTDPITLVAAIPIDDSSIGNYEPYKLTIKNNNSDCTSINYVITMKDFCLNCEATNGVCMVGANSCNCNDGYKIDGSKIKYEIVDKQTGAKLTGVDPYNNLVYEGVLESATDINEYEIKMWISYDATGDDLYVKDSNNEYLKDENGVIVTKNFCSKIDLEVNAS